MTMARWCELKGYASLPDPDSEPKCFYVDHAAKTVVAHPYSFKLKRYRINLYLLQNTGLQTQIWKWNWLTYDYWTHDTRTTGPKDPASL